MIGPRENTALALLTDGHGNVTYPFVYARRDIERLDPAESVVVYDAYDGRIVATAGQVALYAPPIGQEVPTDLKRQHLWVPNCAYCDVWLLEGHGCQYPSYEGDDPNGQVCREHPITDRQRPHQAKYRWMNEQTSEILVADPASMTGVRRAPRGVDNARTDDFCVADRQLCRYIGRSDQRPDSDDLDNGTDRSRIDVDFD